MQHTTIDGKFATAKEAIADVKINQIAKMQPIGDRSPVCVCSAVSERKIHYGVQYWNANDIAAGKSTNSDGSISELCK